MISRLAPLACLAVPLALGGCNPFSFPDIEPALTSIQITAPGAFPSGAARQLVATGQFDNGVRRDLTGALRWTSLDPDIATVAEGGAVRGVAPGSVVIVATDPATAVSGNTTVTVSAAALVSIAVTPPAPSVPLGATAQFTATGTYADGTTENLTESVTWSSSVSAVAAFSAGGPTGLATTATAGTTVVTATAPSSTVSGSATLTVTSAQLVALAVTPPDPSVPVGVRKQFTAVGTYTNGTTEDLTSVVTWSSADETIATISAATAPRGVAIGAALGRTTIRASDPATHVSGSTTITVTPARLVSIAVTPTTPSVPLGLGKQLTATGTYTNATTQDLTAAVEWSSSDPAVASVSNAVSRGFASTAAAGTVTITATDPASSITGSTILTVSAAELVSIEVTPAAASIPLGTTAAFTATGRFTNDTRQDLTAAVTWSSSVPAIASVSNADGSRGVATSASTGETRITATHPASRIAGSGTLTVTSARLVSLAVTPTDPSIPVGLAQAFTATGTYTNGTTQDLTAAVTWSSSDPAVASVSNAAGSEGVATSASTGPTTIRAADPATGIARSTTLTVTPARLVSIAVSPATATVTVGEGQQFTATGTYSDATQQDLTEGVTWTSSSREVAEVSNAAESRGLATGLSAGSATIEGRDAATGIAATATFVVTAATTSEGEGPSTGAAGAPAPPSP